MRTQHFILTRYNVGLYHRRQRTALGLVIDPDAWMADRLKLFEAWCYPSLVDQTERDWQWLIAVDANTPDAQWSSLDRTTVDPRVQIVPCSRAASLQAFWTASVAGKLRPDTQRIVTTRIDNDDALQERAVELIRTACDANEPAMFVDLCVGVFTTADAAHVVQVDRSRMYRRGASPFVSLVEENNGSPPLTVNCGQHVHLASFAPVRRIVSEGPMWSALVHQSNLSNRMPRFGMPLRAIPDGFHVRPLGRSPA